jgi:hypothetical protein
MMMSMSADLLGTKLERFLGERVDNSNLGCSVAKDGIGRRDECVKKGEWKAEKPSS